MKTIHKTAICFLGLCLLLTSCGHEDSQNSNLNVWLSPDCNADLITDSANVGLIQSELSEYYDANTHTCYVYDADGLRAWANATRNDPTLNCTLTADIDLAGVEWTPIGQDFNREYAGIFDGGSHTVSGLTITGFNDNAGFFGRIDSNGKAINLTLENVKVNGKKSVGGVAGYNKGEVSGCLVNGIITGDYFVGGVTGYNNGGSISGCSSKGVAKAKQSYSGGIVGISKLRGNIIGCKSIADAEGSAKVGGVAGRNDGAIIACYHAIGSISGKQYTGGVAGENLSYGNITACYWSDSPDVGIGSGIGATTKVDGSNVTWHDAVTQMNAALNGMGWKYVPQGDSPPTLEPNYD